MIDYRTYPEQIKTFGRQSAHSSAKPLPAPWPKQELCAGLSQKMQKKILIRQTMKILNDMKKYLNIN